MKQLLLLTIFCIAFGASCTKQAPEQPTAVDPSSTQVQEVAVQEASQPSSPPPAEEKHKKKKQTQSESEPAPVPEQEIEAPVEPVQQPAPVEQPTVQEQEVPKETEPSPEQEPPQKQEEKQKKKEPAQTTQIAQTSKESKQAPVQPQTVAVTIAVSGPGAGQYALQVQSGATVETAMNSARAKGFSYVASGYNGLGSYVQSINGTEEGNGMYWIYYINGAKATTGISSYTLKNGDTITWKYEKEY